DAAGPPGASGVCPPRAGEPDTVKLLLATFFVSIASALFPLINIEAYIAGVGALVRNYGIWPVALVAAGGQTVGKAFWYEVGRSSMKWRYIQKKMESPSWQKRYDQVKTMIDERPWAGAGLLALSAVAGFPPLAIMAVLAGQLHFHRVWFYVITFGGRTLRFAAVLGGIAWILHSGIFHS
ncbi:MAG: VTT domain-containing protein, partial [Nocardioidaceae bacterium]